MTPQPHCNNCSVSSDLSEIKTGLMIVFGEKWNNGRFKVVEDTVAEHEAYIQQQKGAGKLGKGVWTTFVALAAAVLSGFAVYLLRG